MKKSLAIAAALVLALAGCGTTTESKTETKEEEKATVEATTSQEETTQSESSVKWTDATTAEDAAKGAGFEKFGVFESIKIGDLEYKEPKFSYAGGVAQATYETPATMLYLRKSAGAHTAPLTDRDETEFTQKWSETYEGLQVNCYGAAKDAATVISWTDGTEDYKVTYQGLGGEEMTMNPEIVASLVKSIKEANAAAGTTATTATTEQTTNTEQTTTTEQTTASTAEENGYISEQAAKDAAIAALGMGDPANVTASLETGGDAPHYNVTVDYGGEAYIAQVDAVSGAVWDLEPMDVDSTSSTEAQSDTSDSGAEAASTDTDYISDDSARQIAVDYLGLGIPNSASEELVTGGDAPHYVVTLVYDEGTETVEVDAVAGTVWE